jgi:hypothetical protein
MRTRLIVATALSLSMIGVAAFALNISDPDQDDLAVVDHVVEAEMTTDAAVESAEVTETSSSVDAIVETSAEAAVEMVEETVETDADAHQASDDIVSEEAVELENPNN